jgi:hypothetical protein
VGDLAAVLLAARYAFVAAALVWLLLGLRVRRPGWLVAGVVAANIFVWAETNLPLQQIYGLPASRDRVGNLALCQVVAAGNSPIRTAQLGQLHFEPFWSAFTAVASGFDPDRLLRLYPYFALLASAGFALSLYFALRPPASGGAWSGWERALVAGFATLLSSTAFEHTGIYRQPWAMTFLLKPNHALGLVLFPIVLAVFVRARTWRGRLAAGLLLHLLGWVFVLHMVYVAAGLVLYAAASLLARHPERRRDAADVAVTLGVNLAVVSPYIVMLFVGYPFFDRNPRMAIAETSPHLLETTARVAPLFALGLWGGLVAWRRQDRLGRVWAAQLVAALCLWVAYLGLGALQVARERDEIYYWVRFLTAAFAGIGAWDLARRAADAWSRPLAEPTRAVLIALTVLPWSLPYWWDPLRMDPYFASGLAPMAEGLRVPTDFLRRQTPPDAAVLSDGDFARYAAAFGARRVLAADTFHQPNGVLQRFAAQDAVLTDVTGASRGELDDYARRYGVSAWYAAVTPRWLAALPGGVTLEEVRGRRHLEPVHFWGDEAGDFVAIFRVRPQ